MGVWFCPVLTVVLRTTTEVCTPRDTSLTVFIMARLGTQPPSTRFVVVLNQRGRQAANQVDETYYSKTVSHEGLVDWVGGSGMGFTFVRVAIGYGSEDAYGG